MVDAAAERRIMTKSEWLRRAILEKLDREGLTGLPVRAA
jgi:hypothetical protein